MGRVTHLHLMHRGLVPTDQLGTGTASGASVLRGNQTWRLDKLNATVAPAVTDDSGDGYSIGSRWLDITNDKEYVCTDATVGAAIWIETTGGGGGGFTGTPETPAGTIDGVNAAFTLSATPANGIILFKNGLIQRAGAGNDYTLATNTITYEAGNIPQTGDSHVAYMLSPAGGSALTIEDEGTPLATDATTLDFVGAGVTASGAGAQKTITIPGGGGTSLDLFGDGQDGTVVINSGAFSLSVGGSALITSNVLVRDAYFADLELNGGDLDLDGFRLFVSGELKMTSGVIKNNGNNAASAGGNGSASAGGSFGGAAIATPVGTTAASAAGINGGSGGFEVAGTTPAANQAPRVGRTAPANGAAGGASGQGQAGGQRNSGSTTNTHLDRGVWTQMLAAVAFRNLAAGTETVSLFLSSAVSGGGGGGHTASGGGGGGGSGASGGPVVVVADTITGTTDIQSLGGNGSNGGNGGGTNAGGGGGGNGGSGGWIVLVYRVKTGWSGALVVTAGTGGTGGTGIGTGSAGGNGSTGPAGITKEWQV